MTRLYVHVRCERCNKVYARDCSRSKLGDKSYTAGVCMWCRLKELKVKTRETLDKKSEVTR